MVLNTVHLSFITQYVCIRTKNLKTSINHVTVRISSKENRNLFAQKKNNSCQNCQKQLPKVSKTITRFGIIYTKLAFLANVLPTLPCNPPKTGAEKKWPYAEYYLGERDEENRKHGKGTHHWSGAESLEWYTGRMLYNTMHGAGDYRWRYLGPDHLATTYEGRFYNNSMHGYGVMSYPDGRVFNGLFYKNYRWGPGVETHACLREDVGLWHGYQIIRLAWRPLVPSVAIDLVSTPIGANTVAQHRVLLSTNVKIIGEVNSALELLKKCGCEPLTAGEKWSKLYSKNCTDLSSPMCHVEAFDRAYYDNGIKTLNEVTAIQQDKGGSQSSTDNDTEKTTYYAWNNNKTMIHMMKHCFTHEEQREENQLSLEKILSGSRSSFKRPGKHELDCRALLMASYLGDISNVATLINECDVVPDVTDVQGNSVIMYAACGDQPDTIHFLVEAGADVDAYNDACCTPLGITLLRYVLVKRGVAYNAMLQALLPPPTAVGPPQPDVNILEWKINRESPDIATAESLNKASKLNDKPSIPIKKPSAKELPLRKKTEPISKVDLQIRKPNDVEMDANTDAKDKHVYDKINTDYLIRVAEAFSVLSEVNPIPYIFEVNDMYKDVEVMKEEEAKKLTEKLIKKIASKPAMKEIPKKPSRDIMFQEKEDALVDTIEQQKQEKMAQIMLTILQLISEGADPRKVRCPQPPLFVATVSGCAELIRHLVKHGADINEVYPQAYGYSILDVAVSGPLTPDNLEVIRALLQSGANPDHRLKVPPSPLPPTTAPPPDIPSDIVMEEGPTLLHAILARKVDAEGDPRSVELRDQLLEMLLQYGCNPITQYKGHSAVDMALNKSLELFDIFLKSPQTDLNAVINDSNQTVLVKIFHMPFSKTIPLPEKLQLLTNLLLFGADPLIKCQNGNEEYGNLFAFVKSVLNEKDTRSNFDAPRKSKSELKSKQPVKPTGSKTSTKPGKGANKSQIASKSGKIADDSHGDYKQALDLVVECARLLYIRWLQANLMKELIEVVNKYKYRHWTMILKEHNNKKCTSLWLTAHRGLEIWDVLKATKKKIYNDERILKQVLCIIHLYFKRTKTLRLPVSSKIWLRPPILFQEKELIEREVAKFTREHRLATMPTPDMVPAIRPYVTPELMVKEIEKFNVCFECALPLGDVKIPCDSCNMIGFCSFDCVKTNIDRFNCHPCSSYLKEKYFPTPEETETNSEVIKLV